MNHVKQLVVAIAMAAAAFMSGSGSVKAETPVTAPADSALGYVLEKSETCEEQLKACAGNLENCKVAEKTANAAYDALEEICKTGCTKEQILNGTCGKKAAPSRSASARTVECRAPATPTSWGTCKCPDGMVLDDDAEAGNGPADPPSDGVAARTYGKKVGACVATFEAVKAAIDRKNAQLEDTCVLGDDGSYALDADQRKLVEETGDSASKRLLANATTRCEKARLAFVWMYRFLEKFKGVSSIPADALKDINIRLYNIGVAVTTLQTEVDGLKGRIGKLEKRMDANEAVDEQQSKDIRGIKRQWVHPQVLGGGVAYGGPGSSVFGGLVRGSLILNVTPNNGVRFFGGGGWGGRQAPLDGLVLWEAGAQWYHFFGEPKSDSTTDFAFMLGPAVFGGSQRHGLNELTGGTIEGGFQVLFDHFTMELSGGIGAFQGNRYTFGQNDQVLERTMSDWKLGGRGVLLGGFTF